MQWVGDVGQKHVNGFEKRHQTKILVPFIFPNFTCYHHTLGIMQVFRFGRIEEVNLRELLKARVFSKHPIQNLKDRICSLSPSPIKNKRNKAVFGRRFKNNFLLFFFYSAQKGGKFVFRIFHFFQQFVYGLNLKIVFITCYSLYQM